MWGVSLGSPGRQGGPSEPLEARVLFGLTFREVSGFRVCSRSAHAPRPTHPHVFHN